MPNTIWDEDAIPILWTECRRKTPECTAEMILEQISNKLKMKSWARIQNPVGFLLTSVPLAVQAAFSILNRGAGPSRRSDSIGQERSRKTVAT
jgi:hypothetical protein